MAVAVMEAVVSVRNTFLHFSTEEEEELVQVARHRRRCKTQPASSAAALLAAAAASAANASAATEGRRRGAPGPQPRSGGEAWPEPEALAPGVTCAPLAGGGLQLRWAVERRRISGQDKWLVSPSFGLSAAGLQGLPFKLVLHAAVAPQRDGRGQGVLGVGFKSADGWARVELKCCADIPLEAPVLVALRIAVGEGERAQPPRGPVVRDLARQSCLGLPKGFDVWHLFQAVDPTTNCATVLVDVLPAPCVAEASRGQQ